MERVRSVYRKSCRTLRCRMTCLALLARYHIIAHVIILARLPLAFIIITQLSYFSVHLYMYFVDEGRGVTCRFSSRMICRADVRSADAL